MTLEMSSELFGSIVKGNFAPIKTFMEGHLKTKGNMADLQKLEIFNFLLKIMFKSLLYYY